MDTTRIATREHLGLPGQLPPLGHDHSPATALSPGRSRSWPTLSRYLLRVLLVTAVYFPAARLGLLLAFSNSNVTPVWPPSGIALAALLALGGRLWPAVTLGAFLANLTTGLPPRVAAGISVGNTLEALLAASVLRRVGFRPSLERVRDVLLLAAIGSLASPLVAATGGTASLWLGGVIPGAVVGHVWALWWVGDGMGILVFTPLLLIFRETATRSQLREKSWAEAGALILAVAVSTGLVFIADFRYPYLLFPIAIWAALRFGQVGVTGVTLAVSGIAIWGTIHGSGPFAPGTVTERLMHLQLYLAAFGLTGLVLATAVMARGQSECRVLQRTAQLEASTRELESFSYSVSHDLRAPLRAIDGFSKTLLVDYASDLPPEVQRYLASVSRNAQHMGRLIDALLNFSRLSRQPLNRQRLDPQHIARQTLVRLRAETEGRNLEVSIRDMPPCYADPVLLGQVYQNLIGNAIKFTRKREIATIEVGWRQPERAPGPTYYVRDNGVGFDTRYSDKLFGVFQRLHRQEDYEGAGAGLAIVQRIISRHEGHVWAESEMGVGACFYFTLGEPPLDD